MAWGLRRGGEGEGEVGKARPKRLRFEVFMLPAKLAIHESQLSDQLSVQVSVDILG